MNRLRLSLLSILLFQVLSEPVLAHQPVMDMAPRWNKGSGVQIRHEWHGSDQLINGDSKIENPQGRRKRVNKTWIEGVYTFTRAARVTIKIPWVDQSRISLVKGNRLRQSDSGWGDTIMALPLKHYQNRGGTTWNVGVTPSIRVPTGSTRSSYPVGDGSTDYGLSVSYSIEQPKVYQFYDLFYWNNTRGTSGIAEGDEVGLDANIGWHPYHSNETNSGIFLMWDVSARHKDRGFDRAGTTGGSRISMGPVFVAYRRNIMFRAGFGVPVYEKVNGTQFSFGPNVNIGIGITF